MNEGRVDGQRMDTTVCDVAVVGAGPTGLFACYYAGFRGLSATLIDSEQAVGGQVAALFPAKTIHDVAGYPGVSGADLVAGLYRQAEAFAPRVVLGANVVDVGRERPDGELVVSLADGAVVRARSVILATGLGGVRPRTLPAGRGWAGKGVRYTVGDPGAHADEDVVVVGGGDSALDWAIELVPFARSVTVVHRRATFRAHGSQAARAEGMGVVLRTEAEVAAIRGGDRVKSVVVRSLSGTETELPADTVIGALGLVNAAPPYESWGLELQNRKLVVDRSMQTNLDGIFAAGDAVTYPGKVSLMAVGFGEAASAVNNAAVQIDPALSLVPGHSTDFD